MRIACEFPKRQLEALRRNGVTCVCAIMGAVGGQRPEPVRGVGGELYYSLSDAAALLGVDRTQVGRDSSLPKVSAAVVIDAQLRPGRPTKLVVPADFVESRRRDLLESLFAVDVRAATEQRQRENDALLDAAERANAQLRERVAALEEVVSLSIVTDGARLEQLQHLLGRSHIRDGGRIQ